MNIKSNLILLKAENGKRKTENGKRKTENGKIQYSCLENSMDRGAWWATVHAVTKSRICLSTHTHIQGFP